MSDNISVSANVQEINTALTGETARQSVTKNVADIRDWAVSGGGGGGGTSYNTIKDLSSKAVGDTGVLSIDEIVPEEPKIETGQTFIDATGTVRSRVESIIGDEVSYTVTYKQGGGGGSDVPDTPSGQTLYALDTTGASAKWTPVVGSAIPAYPTEDGDYSLMRAGDNLSWVGVWHIPNVPDIPDSDGRYIISKVDGVQEWTQLDLPKIPVNDGRYVLDRHNGNQRTWSMVSEMPEAGLGNVGEVLTVIDEEGHKEATWRPASGGESYPNDLIGQPLFTQFYQTTPPGVTPELGQVIVYFDKNVTLPGSVSLYTRVSDSSNYEKTSLDAGQVFFNVIALMKDNVAINGYAYIIKGDEDLPPILSGQSQIFAQEVIATIPPNPTPQVSVTIGNGLAGNGRATSPLKLASVVPLQTDTEFGYGDGFASQINLDVDSVYPAGAWRYANKPNPIPIGTPVVSVANGYWGLVVESMTTEGVQTTISVCIVGKATT